MSLAIEHEEWWGWSFMIETYTLYGLVIFMMEMVQFFVSLVVLVLVWKLISLVKAMVVCTVSDALRYQGSGLDNEFETHLYVIAIPGNNTRSNEQDEDHVRKIDVAGRLLPRNAGSPPLSAREQEVAELMLHGYSTLRISEILGISLSTVKCHIYSIYQKLDVHSRQDLIDLYESAERGLHDKNDESKVARNL